MTFLLTSHGTLICRDRDSGMLVHRPLAAAMAAAETLDIGDLTSVLQVGMSHFLRDAEGFLRVALNKGPLAGWSLTRSDDRRTLLAGRSGRYLIALADREVLQEVEDPYDIGAWFLPLSADDLAVLSHLCRDRWLVPSAGDAMRPATGVLQGPFALRIGAMEVDLRWNLPFDRSEFPHRLILLREGWLIEPIFRYRPLVYFVVYGDESVMRQFAMAAISLVTVGQYDGEILAISDKPFDEIMALFPPDFAVPIAVLPVPAADRVGYIAARFILASWPEARSFQPVLYADTDILFDRPIAPMLHAIAQADRICAVEEPHLLADSERVGSDLLRDDGCDPPPDRYGFDGGILGIPNMDRHGHVLETIVRTLRNRLAVVGRRSVQCVDRPISNYVAYRLDAYDATILAPYARLVNEQARPEDAIGMAHFCWASDSAVRTAAMEVYLQCLLGTEMAAV